jgi:hypothetical protein
MKRTTSSRKSASRKPTSGTPRAAKPATKPSRSRSAARGTPDFAAVVVALKAILMPHAKRLVVVSDGPTGCYLDTAHIGSNKKTIFFGAVRTGKSYVSYHLMPVYACPDLLKGMSPGLKTRMQGKACFNFTTVDPVLFRELAAITTRGVERFTDEKEMAKILSRAGHS